MRCQESRKVLELAVCRFFRQRFVARSQRFHTTDFRTHLKRACFSETEIASACHEWHQQGLLSFNGRDELLLTGSGIAKVLG